MCGFLMLKKSNIVVTGGSGRFGEVLKNKSKLKYIFPTKKQLNILDLESIVSYLKNRKTKILIHLAGLSRPLSVHEKKISQSIQLNIIGTSNIVMACEKLNVKLIYFSTSYVYPGIKGNYKETDSLLPSNNYAWSKLGGESAVHMYKNSLILRVSMTEKPFVHEYAYADMITNFIYHNEFIRIFEKTLNQKGILNIGGPSRTVYNFVKIDNPKIKKKYLKKENNNMPLKASMNLNKLKKIIQKF